MKKFYSLFLLLIFIVFSCKGTPKDDKSGGDPGLSQLELTAEEDEVGVGGRFDDDLRSDEGLAQDGVTDGSVVAENPDADELKADKQIREKPLVVEAVDEVKETPKPEENKPSEPIARPVQPPAAKAEERPQAAETPPSEQPAEEKQEITQGESAAEQKPPERGQPWIVPPPAVTAVKDDAPVPNQRALVSPKEEEIVFSRTVRATVGQIVEIPFRGTGWVYLGEIASRRGIAYNSRRLDIEGQNFIFIAEEAGTYALKFFKHDFIRDYILNDYVQVIIGESPNKSGGAGWFNPPVDRGRVTAEPRWPSALEEEAIIRGGPRPASGAQNAPENKNDSLTAPPQAALPPQTASSSRGTAPAQAQIAGTAPPAAAAQTVTPPAIVPPITAQETPVVEKQEILPPEEILKKAQESFNAGNAASAIALLDQYAEYYPNGNDELYWLYGQFYEANTPSRNILLSLDYYRRLINEYPQSRRFNDARRRIAYLERFYINIQ